MFSTFHQREVILLHVLARNPLHGYALIAYSHSNPQSGLPTSKSSMYCLLHILERKNLIKPTLGRGIKNPSRKTYSLTKAGRQYIMQTKYPLLATAEKQLQRIAQEYSALAHYVQRLRNLST